MPPVIQAALAYAACGLSVLPIAADGSKAPLVAWTPYAATPMPPEDIPRLFPPGCGLAVIGGAVSGGLEVLDFDHPDVYPRWLELLRDTDPELALVVEELPLIETPAGGRHLYYRCAAVEPNQKLARAAEPFVDCTGKKKTVLIETRGERGYVLAPPSPPSCHAAGRPYVHLSGLDPANVPNITPIERRTLLDVARALDEKPPAPAEPPREHRSSSARQRPGDVYNARTSWADILTPTGWTLVRTTAATDYWRRPGKSSGISATTGGRGDWLYVFSTNAEPLDSGRSYTRFAAYAALEHAGDWQAATRGLRAEGYGEPLPEPTSAAPADEPSCGGADEVDPWDDPDYYLDPELVDERATDGPTPDVLLSGAELAAPLPPLDYLIEELGLVAGGGAPHLIAGYGYSGKTLACQAMLLALAAGRPIWGQYRTPDPYRVAHVDLEQGRRLTCSRYQRLAQGMGVHLPSLGETLVAAVMPADLRLTRSSLPRWLRIMTDRSLIVVDSLRAAAGGDENSSEIRSHLDLLGELADVTGCRALLIVHARKPSQEAEGGLYAIRGSSAIYDGADSVLLFGAGKGEPISVEHVKARSTGILAPELALVVEDVPLDEDDTSDGPSGLRVAVRGHELVEESRARAARAARDSCAQADAERIREALHGHTQGVTRGELMALSGLSRRRFDTGMVMLGDAVARSDGPRNTVLHRLGEGRRLQ